MYRPACTVFFICGSLFALSTALPHQGHEKLHHHHHNVERSLPAESRVTNVSADANHIPWPARTPYHIPSPNFANFRLAVWRYGVQIPDNKDYDAYLAEAFEKMSYDINDSFGPDADSHVVNEMLHEFGGNQAISLSFSPGRTPLHNDQLTDLVAVLQAEYDERSLRELFCYVQMLPDASVQTWWVIVAALQVQVGPGPSLAGVENVAESQVQAS